jgi:hypothetical protein
VVSGLGKKLRSVSRVGSSQLVSGNGAVSVTIKIALSDERQYGRSRSAPMLRSGPVNKGTFCFDNAQLICICTTGIVSEAVASPSDESSQSTFLGFIDFVVQ